MSYIVTVKNTLTNEIHYISCYEYYMLNQGYRSSLYLSEDKVGAERFINENEAQDASACFSNHVQQARILEI